MNYKCHNGYTYFGILFIIALIGLSLSGAAMIFQVEQQREKERELLFIGQQYIAAISSYYHAAPGGFKIYPKKMEDLLRDPRYPTVKRHLRKPWRDPLTGQDKWGLVYTQQGGIAGIYSFSNGRPLKKTGFGALEVFLANKEKYTEWRFLYITETSNASDQNLISQDDDNVLGGNGNGVDNVY